MIRTIYRGYDLTGEAHPSEVREIWKVYDPENPGVLLHEAKTEMSAQIFVDKHKRDLRLARKMEP